MSMSGHSLHKKDWLGLAALAGLGATGAGLAGAGPLAGMLGAAGSGAEAAGAATPLLGASGLAEMATPGVATPGIGSTIAQTGLFGHALDLGGMASRFGKVAALGGAAGLLGGSQPQAQAPQSMGAAPTIPNTVAFPQQQQMDPKELMALLEILKKQQGAGQWTV
jgi:hypothetical protein